MPKIKTRRSAAKRFHVTASGLFKRAKQNRRHILTKKNAKRRMHLRKDVIVDVSNHSAVSRMLPYA